MEPNNLSLLKKSLEDIDENIKRLKDSCSTMMADLMNKRVSILNKIYNAVKKDYNN